MDIVERLSLEAAQADTMIACEHRQRYEFAAPLCDGLRVLDLCCGSGYGTQILAAHAREVVGVDNDVATVELAQSTVAAALPTTSFEAADAVEYLGRESAGSFDAIVCFEGLEHLPDLGAALARLRTLAGGGTRMILSVPNSKAFGEENPFHLTDFGYGEAIAAFADFPARVMLPQFLAEGSVIWPAGATGADVALSGEERAEPEYANHFIFCVNIDASAVDEVTHGRMQLSAAPLFNRWSEGMKQALTALRRENARLARARLGKADSAAASALARLADRDAQFTLLQERCRLAEARVAELEAALERRNGDRPAPVRRPPAPPEERSVPVVMAPVQGQIAASAAPGEDPNGWEQRRRRAAEYLIPWIEQTVPLAGKTVLEYGCGNAAVSSAFAERAERVIGVDIDADWIALGTQELGQRGIGNVELELHPLEEILNAVAARRGEVDVFLLYAVLEHLTVPERLEVLKLARDVVRTDGAIVVCETPNRLIYFDHHTAQMPFFHLLPDEVAAGYYPRSARADFTTAMAAAADRGPHALLDAIARWGRGVSFHEFELVFDDGLHRHVIGSNYDPLLFGERPVHPDEVVLARYLDRWRPDLAPVWSRYWLDLILSPQPVDKRPAFIRPWTAETIESRHVGWTRDETLHLAGPDSTLAISLPHPTDRIIIGSTARHARAVTLWVRPEGAPAPLVVSHDAGPGQTAFAVLDLEQPTSHVAVECSGECDVVFVGYAD